MADEYSNNHRDESKERFSTLEAKVVDISHNMAILMTALKKLSSSKKVWTFQKA